MDTSSISSFWSESVRAASWCGHARDFHSIHEPTPSLDLDALKVALTHLDHSPQKEKAFIGRSGALSNRRPPSRGSRSSRLSSADSLHLIQDQEELTEDLVIPRVVNIEVQFEDDRKDFKAYEDKFNKDTYSTKEKELTLQDKLKGPTYVSDKVKEKTRKQESSTAIEDIRRKLFNIRHKRSVGGSNPLLISTLEAEESFTRIKEEVALLAAKRKSSGDVSEGQPSHHSLTCNSRKKDQKVDILQKWNKERKKVIESACTAHEKEGEENRSSSEADFVISDRESIADSGIVNRRTVIKINEKKSRSATNLTPENEAPLWVRDLQTRRSLRSEKEHSATRIVPIETDTDFEGGINVSIVNQSEVPRKDSTSRMYVRQCDSENRPSRASAFNVRRTIEKRQIQQERRERKAHREKIREQLRCLSEGRERRDSSTSHTSSSHLSQSSVRSKSMSSLDQDQDDFRSESPLFKVQSSPTLEKEKEDVRSYLFGASNLAEDSPCTNGRIPSIGSDIQIIDREYSGSNSNLNSIRTEKHIVNLKKKGNTSISQEVNSFESPDCESIDRISPRNNSVHSSVDSHQIQRQASNQCSHQESVYAHTSEEQSLNNYNDYQSNTNELNVGYRCSAKELMKITSQSISENCGKETRPTPPPRKKHRLSLSTGHITLEGEEKPNWIRLAKERRSLRASKPVDQLSDRASIESKEPEWVSKARKKLDALNVTLTSTTDFNSVSSHISETSSAWSRGGLDALDEIREEASRIGVELAEEASARVNEDLGFSRDNTKMLEHNTERSRDPSAERPRVSFGASAVEISDGDSNRRHRPKKTHVDEVRFGDLKHDWGGVQTKTGKTSSGKTKEMRFGDIQTKETMTNISSERTKEMHFGDHVKSPPYPRLPSNPTSPNGNLPVMHFGDTPLNLFSNSRVIGVQSSSKFESVAGPDPTKMTPEQLNQNVEEYDFPIPTGKEDVTEFMKFLEDSLKKTDIVPEVVSSEDHHMPKPKSILKRRSVENVLLELKKEERNDFHQKVEHRKSASFDWDTVDEQPTSPTTTSQPFNSSTKATEDDLNIELSNENNTTHLSKTLQHDESSGKKRQAKEFSILFSPDRETTTKTNFIDLEGDTLIQQKKQKEVENKRKTEGMKIFTIITNPNDVLETDSPKVTKFPDDSISLHAITSMNSKTLSTTMVMQNERPATYPVKSPEIPIRAPRKKTVTQSLSNSNAERSKFGNNLSESRQKQKMHHNKLEANDKEQKISSYDTNEEKRKNSLMEWEALQRKRLDEEEKNRINRNLSMKPVSTKIKELVKMHGTFMSIFGKDKKTDIKGTVDGKDDIVFQKMSSDDLSYDVNSEMLKRKSISMKSPYIVKKLLNPSNSQTCEDSNSDKVSQKYLPKPQSPEQRTSRTSHRSGPKANLLRDRFELPDKEKPRLPSKPRSARERSISPSKILISKERDISPAKNHFTRGRSRSPARSRTVRERTPSPSRVRIAKERSLSPMKIKIENNSSSLLVKSHILRERPKMPSKSDLLNESHMPRKNLYSEKSFQSFENNIRHKECKEKISKAILAENSGNNTEDNELLYSPGLVKRSPKSPLRSIRKEQIPLNTSSTQQCILDDDEFRSADLPSKSQDCVSRVPTLSGRTDKKACFPITPTDVGELENIGKVPENKFDHFCHDKRNEEVRVSVKDPKNRKEWLNRMMNTLQSDITSRPTLDTATPSVQDHKGGGGDEVNHNKGISKNQQILPEKLSSGKPTMHESLNPSSSLSVVLQSNILVGKSEYQPNFKTTQLPKLSTAPYIKSLINSQSSKSEISPPSSPNSIRSSVKEALFSGYPQSCSSSRGPVSLSSILGDSSSRSSSLTSTPYTSPRATPERIIKKESRDVNSKLDIIPESILGVSLQISPSVEDQKENIAPVSLSKSKEKEMPYASLSSNKLGSCDVGQRKELINEMQDDSSRDSYKKLSTPINQFSLGRPSVTMKNLVSGAELQRISKVMNPSSLAASVSEEESMSIGKSKKAYSSNSYPRDNKDLTVTGLSKDLTSLRARYATEVKETHKPLKISKDKSLTKTKAFSDKTIPGREKSSVSRANILSRSEETKYSASGQPSDFAFNPDLSFTNELNDISHRYQRDMETNQVSSGEDRNKAKHQSLMLSRNYENVKFDRNVGKHKTEQGRNSSMHAKSKESSPIRESGGVKNTKEKSSSRRNSKDATISGASSDLPKAPPREGKKRNALVRRNSSLKRNHKEDSKSHGSIKKERRNSEDDPADINSETVTRNDAGWTKTKTTIRRGRLGSSEKIKKIVRANSGKNKKEKSFKTDASKALEAWASETGVDGKLMKKEGQRFSQETEEEVKGGQRTCRSVGRRVIRRGSRRLSGGGELLTETKETSSGAGNPKESQDRDLPLQDPSNQVEVMAVDDGLSRRIKTSTDGERYMTQSVCHKDGKQKHTTQGVNNKTTNSVELIGGDDFDAKREVQGKTGQRVVVERSKDNLGRPSTVVKKFTSQSRIVITKTKRKTTVPV